MGTKPFSLTNNKLQTVLGQQTYQIAVLCAKDSIPES